MYPALVVMFAFLALIEFGSGMRRASALPPGMGAPADRDVFVNEEVGTARRAPTLAAGRLEPGIFVFARPPDELDLRYDGVKRNVPPPAGSILVVPAGSPARWRLSGAGRPPSRAR